MTGMKNFEGEAVGMMQAMLKGFNFRYNPPNEMLTDEWNRKNAWTVERNQCFPPPYGGYDEQGEFCRQWSGATPSEALDKAAAAIARIPKDEL